MPNSTGTAAEEPGSLTVEPNIIHSLVRDLEAGTSSEYSQASGKSMANMLLLAYFRGG